MEFSKVETNDNGKLENDDLINNINTFFEKIQFDNNINKLDRLKIYSLSTETDSRRHSKQLQNENIFEHQNEDRYVKLPHSLSYINSNEIINNSKFKNMLINKQTNNTNNNTTNSVLYINNNSLKTNESKNSYINHDSVYVKNVANASNEIEKKIKSIGFINNLNKSNYEFNENNIFNKSSNTLKMGSESKYNNINCDYENISKQIDAMENIETIPSYSNSQEITKNFQPTNLSYIINKDIQKKSEKCLKQSDSSLNNLNEIRDNNFSEFFIQNTKQNLNQKHEYIFNNNVLYDNDETNKELETDNSFKWKKDETSIKGNNRNESNEDLNEYLENVIGQSYFYDLKKNKIVCIDEQEHDSIISFENDQNESNLSYDFNNNIMDPNFMNNNNNNKHVQDADVKDININMKLLKTILSTEYKNIDNLFDQCNYDSHNSGNNTSSEMFTSKQDANNKIYGEQTFPKTKKSILEQQYIENFIFNELMKHAEIGKEEITGIEASKINTEHNQFTSLNIKPTESNNDSIITFSNERDNKNVLDNETENCNNFLEYNEQNVRQTRFENSLRNVHENRNDNNNDSVVWFENKHENEKIEWKNSEGFNIFCNINETDEQNFINSRNKNESNYCDIMRDKNYSYNPEVGNNVDNPRIYEKIKKEWTKNIENQIEENGEKSFIYNNYINGEISNDNIYTHENKVAKFTLIVNVPPNTTRKDLMAVFSKYGNVNLTMVVCDKQSRHPNKEWTATSGYAFVRFSTNIEAQRTLNAAISGQIRIKGSRVRATWAKKDSYSKKKKEFNLKVPCSVVITNAEGFICCICRNYLSYDPILFPCCYASSCSDCFQNYIIKEMNQQNIRCPNCSLFIIDPIIKLDQNSKGILTLLYKIYYNIKVKCVYERCKWIGFNHQYFSHIFTCNFNAI
ncbi:conserved Plasmodium protein, unknown function [Plasmodium berghei]|uniref:RNA-binding protein, putative n=2 Tax=Plasmodium berghei TaxID=5821 RepID=A0A509ALY2_PLABA|nr:RNA-binding protein, putative [Plasmodium berghei ANKA]CXI42048.1 conserved Plasmodium protein, unknown function [Plasmodium berghei]SCM22031.1 conserved Plasmodium protein, unknown function [Plasmodium berghei]SCN25235.1 conserved Plasmodium protein, unknown function [Plasmodium berghei]SCO60225.1 conserved Plasmodium protein, unknown function [Plasmodium berghei]SCO61858.1 conserved Plasmodium protein, unknown function [Plasmodium berghei]|eukprot:XP_034421514.1 RNA-binding protein, putative [Plasmodium berghei ANKA]